MNISPFSDTTPGGFDGEHEGRLYVDSPMRGCVCFRVGRKMEIELYAWGGRDTKSGFAGFRRGYSAFARWRFFSCWLGQSVIVIHRKIARPDPMLVEELETAVADRLFGLHTKWGKLGSADV